MWKGSSNNYSQNYTEMEKKTHAWPGNKTTTIIKQQYYSLVLDNGCLSMPDQNQGGELQVSGEQRCQHLQDRFRDRGFIISKLTALSYNWQHQAGTAADSQL